MVAMFFSVNPTNGMLPYSIIYIVEYGSTPYVGLTYIYRDIKFSIVQKKTGTGGYVVRGAGWK